MATSTKIHPAVPYTGDDWAQSLSRWLALPMLAMGVMSVAVALVLGVIGGVSIGDFYGGGSPSDLGTGEALTQLTGAFAFLGMGLVLGGVVMSLVNIVRTLRDSGRDVQQALGATPLKLRKPWTGTLTPWVMMTGVMVEVAAFIGGVVAAVSIGGVDPAAIVDPANATAGDQADIGVARAAAAWLAGPRFVGIATLLIAVTLVLVTIQKTLRFQSRRITELAEPAKTSARLAAAS